MGYQLAGHKDNLKIRKKESGSNRRVFDMKDLIYFS